MMAIPRPNDDERNVCGTLRGDLEVIQTGLRGSGLSLRSGLAERLAKPFHHGLIHTMRKPVEWADWLRLFGLGDSVRVSRLLAEKPWFVRYPNGKQLHVWLRPHQGENDCYDVAAHCEPSEGLGIGLPGHAAEAAAAGISSVLKVLPTPCRDLRDRDFSAHAIVGPLQRFSGAYADYYVGAALFLNLIEGHVDFAPVAEVAPLFANKQSL